MSQYTPGNLGFPFANARWSACTTNVALGKAPLFPAWSKWRWLFTTIAISSGRTPTEASRATIASSELMTIASELCGPYVASGRSTCTGWSPVSKSTRPSSVRSRPDHTGMRTISAPPSGKKVERGRSMSPVRSSVSSSRRRAYAPAMRDGREPQWAGELPDLILGGQDGLVNVLGRVLGLAAATDRSRIIVIGALAALLAEAISMGTVACRSRVAEADYYDAELARQRRDVRERPEDKRRRLREALATYLSGYVIGVILRP